MNTVIVNVRDSSMDLELLDYIAAAIEVSNAGKDALVDIFGEGG